MQRRIDAAGSFAVPEENSISIYYLSRFLAPDNDPNLPCFTLDIYSCGASNLNLLTRNTHRMHRKNMSDSVTVNSFVEIQ